MSSPTATLVRKPYNFNSFPTQPINIPRPSQEIKQRRCSDSMISYGSQSSQNTVPMDDDDDIFSNKEQSTPPTQKSTPPTSDDDASPELNPLRFDDQDMGTLDLPESGLSDSYKERIANLEKEVKARKEAEIQLRQQLDELARVSKTNPFEHRLDTLEQTVQKREENEALLKAQLEAAKKKEDYAIQHAQYVKSMTGGRPLYTLSPAEIYALTSGGTKSFF